MTSTSVGWVLLDGQGPDAATLDHDAFDVQSGADGDTSQHAAAARGAQAIATASGHKVGSVRVTWTEDVEAGATALLKSLADLGFDDVHAISLGKAAQAWGIEIGRENEHTKTGLCVLEPDAATIMIVATGAGSVRTAITDTRETAEDLVDWLNTVFRRDGWSPECLYLVGALADLDEVMEPIADALPIPVSDSVDTQLALARGAALATVSQVDSGSSQAAETPRERPWRVSPAKKVTTPAAAETVVVATVSQVDTSSTQAAETPGNESRVDPPRSDRPWLVSHAKKVTISAAAVAVFGAALSLAAGSALNVENASMQAADPVASGAPVTSASVRTVPAPASARQAPQVRPLVGPPPAPPAPPKTLARPAEPVAVELAEPVAVPQHAASALPPANVSAAVPPGPPPMAPLGVPPGPSPMAPFGVPPGPSPMAPLGVPPGPSPMAPFGVPPGPSPMAPLGVPPGPSPMAPFGVPPGPSPMAPLGVPPGPPPMAPLGVPPGPPPMAPLGVPPGPPPMAPLGAPPGPPPMAPLGAPPGPPPMAPLGAPPGPPPMAPLGAPPGPPPMAPLGAPPGPPPMAPLGAPPDPPPMAPLAAAACSATRSGACTTGCSATRSGACTTGTCRSATPAGPDPGRLEPVVQRAALSYAAVACGSRRAKVIKRVRPARYDVQRATTV